MKTKNIISHNKNVKNIYFIEKEFEAGILLKGWEVKSIKFGKLNISNSYIIFKNKTFCLFGTIIQPIIKNDKFDPIRIRKLLFNKNEIEYIYGYIKKKGYTLIVISIYFKNIWIKVKVGLVKGKKKIDKRKSIKNREWNINKNRILKNQKFY